MLFNTILLSLVAAVAAAEVDPRMPVVTPAAQLEQRDITVPDIDPSQIISNVNSAVNSGVSDANSAISDANSVISDASSDVTSAISDANSAISSAGSFVSSVISATTTGDTTATTATSGTQTQSASGNEGPRQTGFVAAAAAIAGMAGAVVLL